MSRMTNLNRIRNWYMKARVFLTAWLIFFTSIQAVSQVLITLEQAVSLALEKNYDVLIAKNLANATSMDNDYAFGAFLPQLNGVASKTWVNNDLNQVLPDRSERKVDNIKSNTLNAAVQLNWLLFDGTKMFATRERIAEMAAQGEIRVKEQMVLTIATII